jgi:two-component system cell cycle sensor histidine kinase/response regulator CckA
MASGASLTRILTTHHEPLTLGPDMSLVQSQNLSGSKKIEEALRAIAQGHSGAIGEAFFQHLVQHLAKSLQAEFVFIGELKRLPPADVKKDGAGEPAPDLGDTPQIICTLAVSDHDHIAANFEYPLAGTPCETVVNKQLCCYPRGVQQKFPDDRMLAELAAESYVGTPLFDSAGRPLGLMAVLFCRPLDEYRTIESLLRIFATRAAAEIERRQFEQELEESERRYRTITENIGVGILQVSPTGETIYANPALCAMFEVDGLEDVKGADYKSFFTAESWDTVMREKDKRHNGLASSYEVEILGQRGGRRQVVIFGAPILGPNGEFHSYLGTYTDITAQKRAEEELRGSEARYQTLAEVSPVGIFRTDAQGQCNYANGRALRMAGLTSNERLQETWTSALHPEDRARFLGGWAASVAAGVPYYSEHRFLRPDASVVWVVCQAVAERDAEGNISGFVGTLVDITERKRAENLLRQSEHRNRLLVETARDIIYTLAPDGTFTSISPAFETITAWPVADWLGKSFASLVHADDQPLAANMFNRCLRGESLPIYEARLRKQDRDFAVGEFTVTPLLEAGRVTGVLGIGRDITERKRLEDQFRQSQKMEAIGQLAGGVAHDFNNLLTVIAGNAELLFENPTLDSPHARECLQDIKQAGLKAASLTRQLLAFSRKQLLAPELLNLNDLIANLEKMLRRLIGEDIVLVTDLAPDLWLVKADPGQIEQVLLNLAVNSRDAMQQGGRLTITTANAVLDHDLLRINGPSRSGDAVLLSVQDTGCGMDEITRARIFEPFFTTKEVGKGTGLGLATVYGIVSQSNGHIEVSTEVGHGTTFHIYLPRHQQLAASIEGTAPGPIEPRGTETVLLVEDEDMVRNLLRDILVQAGYTVLEARHGTEAVRVCEQYGAPIHLVITDVVMPEMGGTELVRRLTHLRPQINFLYISGYTDDALIRQGMRREEVSFLHKPFTRQVLTQKVRDILDL